MPSSFSVASTLPSCVSTSRAPAIAPIGLPLTPGTRAFAAASASGVASASEPYP